MLRKQIKTILNTVPLLTTIGYLVDDFLAGKRMAAGKIDTITGSKHQSLALEESIDYIEEVLADYKHYGEIEKFYGVIAEVGPGDNAGVALLMRHDGCSRVDLIDRYYSKRNIEQQGKIYTALDKKYNLDVFNTGKQWDEKLLSGINWKIGQSAEDYFQKVALEQGEIYDFIVSRSVLEHLYNPITGLRHMVDCLKPGGRIFHKIDFRDHGMFTPKHHELTFLEIPQYLYPRMVQNSGRPNRILVHRYKQALEEMKNQGLISYKLLVTRLVEVGDIQPHKRYEEIDWVKRQESIRFIEQFKNKFAKEFYHLNSEELSVTGVFLVVTKNNIC
ncbi:class I SAM-dependent methyltransferase [Laspinema sp. D1]|uniref:methyltransferase domain-containing protein n=1 Tax=Laspinema palackyanum TaxID=3231601 RepID=UPI0034737172|nr:class I SAM-dependent methyltransferase [Laspinema sp. D2b]